MSPSTSADGHRPAFDSGTATNTEIYDFDMYEYLNDEVMEGVTEEPGGRETRNGSPSSSVVAAGPPSDDILPAESPLSSLSRSPPIRYRDGKRLRPKLSASRGSSRGHHDELYLSDDEWEVDSDYTSIAESPAAESLSFPEDSPQKNKLLEQISSAPEALFVAAAAAGVGSSSSVASGPASRSGKMDLDYLHCQPTAPSSSSLAKGKAKDTTPYKPERGSEPVRLDEQMQAWSLEDQSAPAASNAPGPSSASAEVSVPSRCQMVPFGPPMPPTPRLAHAVPVPVSSSSSDSDAYMGMPFLVSVSSELQRMDIAAPTPVSSPAAVSDNGPDAATIAHSVSSFAGPVPSSNPCEEDGDNKEIGRANVIQMCQSGFAEIQADQYGKQDYVRDQKGRGRTKIIDLYRSSAETYADHPSIRHQHPERRSPREVLKAFGRELMGRMKQDEVKGLNGVLDIAKTGHPLWQAIYYPREKGSLASLSSVKLRPYDVKVDKEEVFKAMQRIHRGIPLQSRVTMQGIVDLIEGDVDPADPGQKGRLHSDYLERVVQIQGEHETLLLVLDTLGWSHTELGHPPLPMAMAFMDFKAMYSGDNYTRSPTGLALEIEGRVAWNRALSILANLASAGYLDLQLGDVLDFSTDSNPKFLLELYESCRDSPNRLARENLSSEIACSWFKTLLDILKAPVTVLAGREPPRYPSDPSLADHAPGRMQSRGPTGTAEPGWWGETATMKGYAPPGKKGRNGSIASYADAATPSQSYENYPVASTSSYVAPAAPIGPRLLLAAPPSFRPSTPHPAAGPRPRMVGSQGAMMPPPHATRFQGMRGGRGGNHGGPGRSRPARPHLDDRPLPSLAPFETTRRYYPGSSPHGQNGGVQRMETDDEEAWESDSESSGSHKRRRTEDHL